MIIRQTVAVAGCRETELEEPFAAELPDVQTMPCLVHTQTLRSFERDPRDQPARRCHVAEVDGEHAIVTPVGDEDPGRRRAGLDDRQTVRFVDRISSTGYGRRAELADRLTFQIDDRYAVRLFAGQ